MSNQINKQVTTVITFANAGEVISRVIKEIAGNDISNSLNGSKITNEVICSLTYQRIANKLQAGLKSA